MRRGPARDPILLRFLLRLLVGVSRLVPRALRADWLGEWEAEVRQRWLLLDSRRALGWRQKADLAWRLLGSTADAAWVRRQFTADADLVHDLAHGLRLLRRNLGLTVAAVVILSVGIGANVAVFSVVDQLLLRDLPFPDGDRVVTLWQTDPPAGVDRNDVAPANFLDWKERSRSFEALAAADPRSMDHTGGDAPEVFFAALVTEGFFRVLGVNPLLGRTLRPEDHQPGRDRVVVLSHAFWQQRFGGDRSIVGRKILLNGEPWEVVGVLPPGIEPRLLPTSSERGLWAPKVIEEWEPRIRGSAFWNVIGRLRPGVTVEEARAELDAIAAGLAREHPRTNANSGINVIPLRDHLAGNLRQAILVLAAAVALVLLIACANVGNLLLARAAERMREFAVRLALGASRGRVVRQVLAESLLLAGLGCAGGLILARWGLATIAAIGPDGALRTAGASLDARVLGFAAALSTLTAIASGIGPALVLAGRTPASSLGASRSQGGGGAKARLRGALVVAEIALAMVLTAGAALLLTGFVNLLRVDPGFVGRHVLALQVFAWDRHPTPEQRIGFFAEAVERLGGLPGVEAVGLVSAMPFIESNINIESPMRIQGRAAPNPGDEPSTFVNVATAGYFEAMKVPLRHGRMFNAYDRRDAPQVVLINDIVARRGWPNADPLGQRITVQLSGRPWTAEIVGVVGSVRHDGLDRQARPEVFLPHAQSGSGSMTIVMRAAAEPELLIEATKRQVWALDPLQAFYRTATVEELLERSTVERRFSVVLLGALALIALVLAVVGVYAVISFSTKRRTQEIGVRLAMGATGAQILRMLIGESARLAAAGVALGLAGAIAFGHLLRGLLFEVAPADPWVLAAVAMLLTGITLAASFAPARRATRVDPVNALRGE